MENMFCFQCEQTAKGTGCTVSGVCGKNPTVAGEQDALTCEMIALASAALQNGETGAQVVDPIVDGLFTTITNVNFDPQKVADLARLVKERRVAIGGETVMEPENLFHGDEDVISLRSTLLFGLRGMAAYAHHARVLGKRYGGARAGTFGGAVACVAHGIRRRQFKMHGAFG
jgi:hydroxylamine reductase